MFQFQISFMASLSNRSIFSIGLKSVECTSAAYVSTLSVLVCVCVKAVKTQRAQDLAPHTHAASSTNIRLFVPLWRFQSFGGVSYIDHLTQVPAVSLASDLCSTVIKGLPQSPQ